MKKHFETFKKHIGDLHAIETRRVCQARKMQDELADIELEDEQAQEVIKEVQAAFREQEKISVDSMNLLEKIIDELNTAIDILGDR